jgi:UDP-N-acetylmuramoyl-tripeptide--D-alanyl-D-alanine ligase
MQIFLKILQFKLKILSKIILEKYRPEIIGITGSVGKTSAKEAVFAVLSYKLNARRSEKNYNNELGLPLGIIGADTQGKSLAGWIKVFFKAIKLILVKDKDYPQILILEMGVDHPGDMDYLLKIVHPKIGIVTRIGESHLEFFGSPEGIQREKKKIIKALPKSGWAILNNDDPNVKSMSKETKASVLTYGLDPKAEVRAQEIKIAKSNNGKNNSKISLTFKLTYKGSFVPVMLDSMIGDQAVEAALIGASAGIAYGMNLVEISEALKSFKPPRGRMNIIAGIKNTLILDDTYNAAPLSTIAALNAMERIVAPGNVRRKFAVLGDMLELGSYTEEGHRAVGAKAAEIKIDELITVGERARDIDRGARDKNMKEDKIFNFPTPEEAGRFVQNRINPGDLILVKGSQGMRMEKVVKEIMAEPLKAKELLVRQDWNK